MPYMDRPLEETEMTIRKLTIEDLQQSAIVDQIITEFRAVKPDSAVCRIPARLVPQYFCKIIEDGGMVLVAKMKDEIAGFLIFVRDNNVTLEFLRTHKVAIGLGLLLSASGYDKILLSSLALNFILMLGKDLPPEFENEISLLAVSSRFRGKGVGTALVDALRREGLSQIRVKTDAANAPAVKFYERNGFARVGQIALGRRTLVTFEDTRPGGRAGGRLDGAAP
jgi:ribosomal protein S18 acetylase RimI-like enzyme